MFLCLVLQNHLLALATTILYEPESKRLLVNPRSVARTCCNNPSFSGNIFSYPNFLIIRSSHLRIRFVKKNVVMSIF